MRKTISSDNTNLENRLSKDKDLRHSFKNLFKLLKDPKKVEQEWNNGELEEDILNVLDGPLLDLEKLYELCQTYPFIRESMNPYVALSIIHLKLVDHQADESIEPYLHLFIEDPVKTIDLLMKIVNLLVLFGYASLAANVCQRVFERVAQAENLLLNPEDNLAIVIFCDELQKVFIRLKEGESIDWSCFDELIHPYGYHLKKLDHERMEQIFLRNIDPIAVAKQFKKKFSRALLAIQEGFFADMWRRKKIPFATSEAISSLVLRFLASRQKIPNCDVNKFFLFEKIKFEKFVIDVIGWPLPCLEDGVALLWGLPLFYTYLNDTGLIDGELFAIAIQNTDSLKNQLESEVPNLKDRFNFVEFLTI